MLVNHTTYAYMLYKRPIDHIAHLRNQVKSMNTFERSKDYINYKIGPVVHEEKIYKFRECTFAIFFYYLPMFKGVAFPFEQT